MPCHRSLSSRRLWSWKSADAVTEVSQGIISCKRLRSLERDSSLSRNIYQRGKRHGGWEEWSPYATLTCNALSRLLTNLGYRKYIPNFRPCWRRRTRTLLIYVHHRLRTPRWPCRRLKEVHMF